MSSLLLEIGVEEIPSKYIQPAVRILSESICKQLLDAKINYGDVNFFATPRRLAVLVKEISKNQKEIHDRIYGPSESIGIDDNGNYTLASIKFAEKLNVPLNRLEIVPRSKGRYISVLNIRRGKSTKTLLENILPKLILSIPFPKSMRWSNLSIRFARPIRNIIALFGNDIINFKLDDTIKSGRTSTGHSFMSNSKTISIFNPNNYLELMKKANIIVDIKERYNLIIESTRKAADSIGGSVLPDDSLLNTIVNLVEFPVAVIGKFDSSFLNIPKEILVMTMREHQKYFALIDKNKNLLPNFIAISNNLSENMEFIVSGYERVLLARLSDANFFYDSDVSSSMDTWVENLKGVLFHSQLGSMHDKMLRLKKIIIYLINIINIKFIDIDKVKRAAYLCKADLNSQIVKEFPKLQGIMGTVYARLAGESEEICLAIKEHYQPIKSGGKIPETKIGALLSITDKIDSICGCFLVGLEPTGTTDPYALRRQSIGLLRIMRHFQFNLDLEKLVCKSLEQYTILAKDNLKVISTKVCNFLSSKFSHILLNNGYSPDVIEAVTTTVSGNIIEIESRIVIIEKFKKTGRLTPIITSFKRINNLLKKSKLISYNIYDGLFRSNSEILLYKFYCNTDKKLDMLIDMGNLSEVIKIFLSFCKPIDLFFQDVMIMDKNEKIRCNRLALLNSILNIFLKLADFSKISI